MEIIRRIAFTSMVALLGLSSQAHAQVSMEATFRPRTEFRNGYRRLMAEEANPAFFVSQRTRIGLLFSEDQYQIGFSGQDVRIWGASSQLGQAAGFNIHEAWGDLRISPRWSVKAGRQELVYDNQRLLGSVNWTQQGRSHDAAVVSYRDTENQWAADLGLSFHQNRAKLTGTSYPRTDNYKMLFYGWLQKSFGSTKASLLYLMDGFDVNTTTRYRHTFGGRLTREFGPFFAAVSYYRQKGGDQDQTELSAFMYSVQTGYAIKNLSLRAGYDHLSGGRKNGKSPYQRAFNTLYATNHKFYGHMDYFLNIPRDTRYGGLEDFYLRSSLDLSKRLTLNLDLHHFTLAGPIPDPGQPTQDLGTNLGNEVDLSASIRLFKQATLKAGYSSFAPTETLESLQQVQADQLQHWGWVMLTLHPQFEF